MSHWQDVENGSQLRSRIPQRLHVRSEVRIASSLAAASLTAFLNILRGSLLKALVLPDSDRAGKIIRHPAGPG